MTTLDINQIIDKAKATSFLVHIVVLGCLCSIIEGFEMIVLGMIIPNLAKDWGLKPEDFEYAHLAVLFGILAGSIFAGILMDKIGRRKSMLLMFGLGTIGMGVSFFLENMTQLIILRFLTGLGAGGSLPIALAIVTEYSPKKVRNMLAVLVYAGAPFATTVGGYIGPHFIEMYDWKGMFLLGFMMSLPIFLWMVFFLPESLKYLVAKEKNTEKAKKLLIKVDSSITIAETDRLFINEKPIAKSPIGALFSEGRSIVTFLLWIAFIGGQFIVYFMSLWLPTILQNNGWEQNLSLNAIGHYYLGAGIGGIIIGWMADRWGSAKVLAIAFPLAALLYFWLGQVVDDPDMWFIIAPFAGAVSVGAMMAKAPFAASLYPTTIRGTGIGTAMGVGRIGGLLTPGVGAALVAANVTAAQFYNIATIAPIICASAILVILLITRKKKFGTDNIQ
ncbi:MFS transporter, AAHS family, benzoate transport protein/MFS transporter, AAHS family, 4-hydroxybenzoate transporter [Zobellia uliginosa]|uniref:MFS transporter, AAHS family, benzoate transport protein/MFS transporter, AAHS family, 4-hydroxybenzoate transporter n=1 Tax=Zobellia uliginosa TaxID=143224 RepID=A0ABY1KK11_9FLAO|nr:MFS transporter [Zobellia uliginosa]SIS43332.1 MFS transporter, AAHS family, benzoate transport protein/MFS transporter, AAHS family, 4-hydroxybenzoate transporter [Zobellia uliginosa]